MLNRTNNDNDVIQIICSKCKINFVEFVNIISLTGVR